jgi:hypothetical protein
MNCHLEHALEDILLDICVPARLPQDNASAFKGLVDEASRQKGGSSFCGKSST